MNKLLLIVYIITLFLASGLALVNIRRIHFERKLYVEKSMHASKKNEYLIRCIMYNSLINKQKNYIIENSNVFVLLFVGESCGICVESLLNTLRTKFGLRDRIRIVIDDEKKKNYIINFNDAFRLNYEYNILPKNLFEPINEILLVKIINGEVINVLEYRPHEQYLFEEYFKVFNNNDVQIP